MNFARFMVTLMSLAFCQLPAQVYNYTWMKGAPSSTFAVYGTLGVASASSNPGSLADGITWTDQSGNLWLYGGQGFDNSNFGYLNDLWKYSPLTDNWTWVNGSGTVGQAAVYGTLGVASSSNNPGGRSSAAAWADGSGNLWLFGGSVNQNISNDLWRYNIASNQWTWMGGANTPSQSAVHGTQAVPATTNIPGASYNFSSWKDPGGNFWLYDGINGTEIWKYIPSTGQWAWMSGTITTTAYPVFGTMGVSSPSVNPGTRNTEGIGDASGNLYVFGGQVYTATGFGKGNDLWKYTISNNQWTWIGGTQYSSGNGAYGTQGVFSATNVPTGRYGHVMWVDGTNKLWLFGGEYLSLAGYYVLNDTWCYDISNGQWAWMKGSNTAYTLPPSAGTGVVYGTQLIPSASNTPGWHSSAAYWPADPATLWLYSGSEWTHSTELWRLNGCASSSTVSISSSQATLCAGSTAILTASGSAGSYSWSTGAQTNTISVSPSSTTVYYALSTGTASCYSAAEFTLPVQSLSISLQNPTNPVCSGNSYVLSASSASSYSWSTGQNSQTISVVPQSSTVYSLTASLSTCTMATSYSMNVVQSPSISIVGTSYSVCAGYSASLTAFGASSYTWSGGQTGQTVVVSPPTSTIYSVAGTLNSCTSSATYTLGISPNLVLSISSSASVSCSGYPLVLTASGAGFFNWSTGQTGSSVVVAPSISTIYTVTGMTSICSGTATFSQQVVQLPTLSVSGPTSMICRGETVTLSVSGASTYAWSGLGSTNPIIQVNPTLTTSYTVTGTGTNGCQDAAAITVSVAGCVGVQNYATEEKDFDVYPNPASTAFTIRGAPGRIFRIMNSLGQIVLEKKLDSEAVVIHDRLPSGVYYCVTSGTEKAVKLVIQE